MGRGPKPKKSKLEAKGPGRHWPGAHLCRKFAEWHGGKIWVKSEVAQGAAFTFTLPVHPGD